MLPWAEFDRINAEREAAGEPLFANPRNAASGTLKLLNSAEVARRGLDAYLYYLLGENLPFDNHYDNMKAAESWGFRVSKAMTRLHTIEEVDEYIRHWDTARKELPVRHRRTRIQSPTPCASNSTSASRRSRPAGPWPINLQPNARSHACGSYRST